MQDGYMLLMDTIECCFYGTTALSIDGVQANLDILISHQDYLAIASYDLIQEINFFAELEKVKLDAMQDQQRYGDTSLHAQKVDIMLNFIKHEIPNGSLVLNSMLSGCIRPGLVQLKLARGLEHEILGAIICNGALCAPTAMGLVVARHVMAQPDPLLSQIDGISSSCSPYLEEVLGHDRMLKVCKRAYRRHILSRELSL